MDDDTLIFSDESCAGSEEPSDKFWKVMVIDDEKSVHDITVASLKGFMFEGRSLKLLNAYSGQQAVELFEENPDTALLLVDVVMETQSAGLNFVHYVRHKLRNNLVQIVIRTGQPGMAPESEVINKYSINAYYSKTELKVQKLISLITTSLRMYKLSISLEQELEKRRVAEHKLMHLNRHLEDKVRERTRQAERANQLKSQFLANMSHEIRTPMNGIMGMAQILMEDELNEQQKEYAGIIHKSATTLLTIINDILDLSKIESGQLTFEKRSFSLKMLLSEVDSIFRFKAREKGLDLKMSISDDQPHFVIGDETRVKQILINLVGNAIKFTRKGEVSLALTSRETKTGVLELHFTVNDTGPGIDEQFKEQLFDKFSQEDASIARKFGGTGLGLSISRQLARMMEGDIQVKNRPEGGASFRVTLKVGVQHNLAQEEQEQQQVSQRALEQIDEKISAMNLKVLLAEDNRINQKVIRVMLKKRDIKLDIAENGESVLKLLKKNTYDLILMDVRMPVLDGIQATRIIRDPESDIPQKQIPIIALTALAMPEDAERCLSAGMDRYLSKPLHADQLMETIARIFDL